MHDLEIQFLEVLHQATEQNLIAWKRAPNDDRDLYQADVDGEILTVELVYFAVATGEAFERVLARVSGLKVCFHVAVGTKAYELIASMLSMQISGWDKGRAAGIARLEKAITRVRSLIAKA